MKLTLFHIQPPYESKLVSMLTSYTNVIGIQEKGIYTFKFWTTSRTVTDKDVQGVCVLKSIDKNNNPHYMLITAMNLMEKEYEDYDEALLITPLEEIDSRYVIRMDEKSVDINDKVMDKYKDDFIKIQ